MMCVSLHHLDSGRDLRPYLCVQHAGVVLNNAIWAFFLAPGNKTSEGTGLSTRMIYVLCLVSVLNMMRHVWRLKFSCHTTREVWSRNQSNRRIVFRTFSLTSSLTFSTSSSAVITLGSVSFERKIYDRGEKEQVGEELYLLITLTKKIKKKLLWLYFVTTVKCKFNLHLQYKLRNQSRRLTFSRTSSPASSPTPPAGSSAVFSLGSVTFETKIYDREEKKWAEGARN